MLTKLTYRSITSLLILFQAASAFSQVNKVLLIGIDGVRPDALQMANTPNMDVLTANATYTYDAINDGITVTGPGWASLLTGVWPAKHGITDNTFNGSNTATYPHLFQRIEEFDPELHTVSICQWAPINTYLAEGAADTTITTADDATLVEQAATNYLSNYDPDAIFVYFDDPDDAGHASGFSPDNPDYLDAIEYIDQAVGNIMTALYARPNINMENWAVLVSTDHGGIGTEHGGNTIDERNIFFIMSGDSIPNTEVLADSVLVSTPPAMNCLNDSVELYFDETTQVTTPLHPDFNFGSSQDFSVECRVRTPFSGDYTIITDKDWDTGANPGWVFSFNINGGPWRINVGDGSNRADLEGNEISDNQWHMISATFDRDGLCKIYEDGAFVGSASMANVGDIYTGFPLLMGMDAENDYPFPGHISEVRVFKEVLAPTDINNWHCTTLDDNHPNFNDLIGHWKLNDGNNSSTVLDSGPFALHGTVNSGEWRNAVDTIFTWEKDYNNAPKQVEYMISALEHLCVPIDTAWHLDGNIFGTSCTDFSTAIEVVQRDIREPLVYPNPSTGQFTIENFGNAVEIYDVFGRLVEARPASSRLKEEFDLFPQGTGMYFIRMHGTTRVLTQTVLLVRQRNRK